MPKEKRVYIGLGTDSRSQSVLANPFPMILSSSACVKLFKQYAYMIVVDRNPPSVAIQRLKVYTVHKFIPPSRKRFMDQLASLEDDSFLICYCYKETPLTWQGVYNLNCHGEVIAGLYEFLKLGEQGG
ncbi:DUF4326 domain-containing protein [Nodosilinea sp. LEGE 06152]|nr:DUF4326 domain-containing protein [Nodosilinea sp. LEGE 06152]